MTLYETLQIATSEEDVKAAYIKALGLKNVRRNLKEFIETMKRAIASGEIIRTQITPDNLKQVFDRWVETLGANWQRDYIVWDMCCGVGNLETKHGNARNVFMTTLDQPDVDVMKATRPTSPTSKPRTRFLAINSVRKSMRMVSFAHSPFRNVSQRLTYVAE